PLSNSVTSYTLEELLLSTGLTLDTLPYHLRHRYDEIRSLEQFNPAHSSHPFPDRLSLEIALFAFQHAKLSEPNMQRLFNIFDLIPSYQSPFHSREELLKAIDAIPYGELETFEITIEPSYARDEFADSDDEADYEESDGEGEAGVERRPSKVGNEPLSWFRPVSFTFTNLFSAVQHLLARPDLADSIEYTPRRVTNQYGDRVISDFMTANWAHQAQSSRTDGVMPMGLIAASDETQLASMTGQQKAYPGYITLGAFSNSVRADVGRDTTVELFQLPILHIPKADREHPAWSSYLRQLVQQCLEVVFADLASQSMDGTPFYCPDGRYRKLYLLIAAWIADYKEKVRISLIVSGRCPICIATRAEMELIQTFAARVGATADRLRLGGLTKAQTKRWGLKPGTIPRLPAVVQIATVLLDGLPGVSEHVVRSFRSYIELGMSLRRHKHSIPSNRNLDTIYTPPSNIDLSQRPRTTFELMEHQLEEYRRHRNPAFESVVDVFFYPRQHSLAHACSSVLLAGSGYGTTSEAPEHIHGILQKGIYKRTNKVDWQKQSIIIKGRLGKCKALSRHIEAGGQLSLHDLAREARQKRNGKSTKARSSRHREVVEAWTRGEPFERVLLGKKLQGLQRSLEFNEAFYDLPFLTSATASYLATVTISESRTTTAEREKSLRSTLPSKRITVAISATIYGDVPDPTHEPDGEREYSKTIIRAISTWGYRDEASRGGVSLKHLRTRKPRYDFVLFQDTDVMGFSGIGIGRVRLLFVVTVGGKLHQLAYIEEYRKVGKDAASGLWRLEGKVKNYKKAPRASGRVIDVEAIISAAHVVPRWAKLSGRVNRWNLFETPGVKVNLNHFIDVGTWDLVEDTAL
ncbi:hypothetical protein P7C70_g8123, partial [Phenoliferia sp. Uapishka_3]